MSNLTSPQMFWGTYCVLGQVLGSKGTENG